MEQQTLFIVSLFILIVCTSLVYIYVYSRTLQVRIKGEFFESHRGPIHYKTIGENGPVVVFIHGLGASQYCWREIAPALSQDGRILLFDLWGFGESSKQLDGPMTIDDQVQIILDLFAYLNIKKAFVVGHSMGGEIAFWLARKAPHRVKKLVAIAPAIEPRLVSSTLKKMGWVANFTPWLISRPIIQQTLKRLILDSSKVTPLMVENYFSPYKDAKAHLCFAAALDIIRDNRVYEQLEHIKVPTLLLWGEKDSVVSLKVLEKIKQRLPHAQSTVHPQAGHLPMEDQAQWVADQVHNYFFSG